MPRLTRLDTGDAIGTLTDAQLASLVAELAEDHEEGDDYFLDRETLELLGDNGADPEVVVMLEKAMGDDDTMTIVWDDKSSDDDDDEA